MGLLDIFIQNQSQLDVTPTPQQGNGPIAPATGEFNTGTTPFQQVWDSSNTYINSFEGGVNTGIQPPTLSETGLDVDNPNFIPSTTIPDTLTYYPATAVGGLGQSAVQFLQIWTPVINYNDVVVGAPTSPLEQSLNQTGLDNTDPNSVPTTDTPSTTTVYPSLATGEYNSAPSQYTQPYTSNNTYLNSFNPNTQVNSLSDTGLDIENIGLVSTTLSPSTNTSYPNLASGEFGGQSNNFNQVFTPNNTYLNSFNPQTQPNTVIQGQTGLDNTNLLSAPTTTTPIDPTQYPNQSTGEFGGASTQYSSQYGPNNTYENTYVDNLANFDTLQTTTLDETGLDNTNSNVAPTTTVPVDPTQYPQFVQGEFNSGPNLYSQVWGPSNQYIVNYNPNVQPDTIIQGQTGLDNINPVSAPTTTTPSTPTNYPNQATGEFGGAPTQYNPSYSPNSTYENTYINDVANFDTLQTTTLDETGLDNSNPNLLLTTTTPNTITQYPQFTQGEFNGAPTQYNQIWSSTNQYIINYNPNIQPDTLNQTGLDIENQNFISTTTTPNTVTQYPQFVQGEFNEAPTQYAQIWGPTNQYVINYNPNIQPNTLGSTGLDNTNSTFIPGTATPTPVPAAPAQLPLQTYMGEFQDVAQPFVQQYNPNPGGGYLDTYNNIIANAMTNAQVKTVIDPAKYGTGLDNTNPQASQTTFIPVPVGISATPPVLPAQTFMGEFQGGAQQFNPQYNPNVGQSYLDDYSNIVDNATNPQINTLDETGLDLENSNAAPTTYVVPITDDTFSTGDVPLYVHAPTAINNSAPRNYTQTWSPNNEDTKYYDYMRNNFQLNYL
jgi:hypothetical protein